MSNKHPTVWCEVRRPIITVAPSDRWPDPIEKKRGDDDGHKEDRGEEEKVGMNDAAPAAGRKESMDKRKNGDADARMNLGWGGGDRKFLGNFQEHGTENHVIDSETRGPLYKPLACRTTEKEEGSLPWMEPVSLGSSDSNPRPPPPLLCSLTSVRSFVAGGGFYFNE